MRAGCGAGIAVVAAKTDEGIFRAIDPVCFVPTRHGPRLVDSVLRCVGALRPGVEWTAYVYPGQPSYLAYGYAEGWPDCRDSEQPSGVWLFRWSVPPDVRHPLGCTEQKGVLVGPLVGRRP